MTAQEPRESSAMTAIAEIMLHLHDALEQEKKSGNKKKLITSPRESDHV